MRKLLVKKRLIELGLIFFVFGVLLQQSLRALDPDFGWRLKVGELILSSGIPKTDPFSYTMTSFPFVDHEWLTHVVISRFYSKFGYSFLVIIYAGLALLSLILALKNRYSEKIKKSKIDYFQFLPFLLAAGAVLPFIGVRPQVESWLLLAILLRIILQEKNWHSYRNILPFFFILWANLHGSFALGIFTLYLAVFLRSFRLKKIELQDMLVLFFSLTATFFNPYGSRLWGTVWQSLSDTSLHWKIAEWLPSFFSINFPFLALVSLSSILILKYKKKFLLEETGLFLFFLFQAISSLRHIPLFVIYVLPISLTLVELLYQQVKSYQYGTLRFKKLFNFFLGGAFCLFVLESYVLLNEARFLEEKNFYPLGGVGYLRENLPPGQIFSEYGWGGYLIWKLPQKKVFIDGRMPSWRWQKTSPEESDYAMRDYNLLLKGELAYKQVFSKYGIKTVLWPQPGKENALQRLMVNLEWLIFKKRPTLLEELKKGGWQTIYQDQTAVIYQEMQPVGS